MCNESTYRCVIWSGIFDPHSCMGMLRAKTSFSNYHELFSSGFIFFFFGMCLFLLVIHRSESLLGMSDILVWHFLLWLWYPWFRRKHKQFSALCMNSCLCEVLQLSVLMQMHPCSQGRSLYLVSPSSELFKQSHNGMKTIFLLASVLLWFWVSPGSPLILWDASGVTRSWIRIFSL